MDWKLAISVVLLCHSCMLSTYVYVFFSRKIQFFLSNWFHLSDFKTSSEVLLMYCKWIIRGALKCFVIFKKLIVKLLLHYCLFSYWCLYITRNQKLMQKPIQPLMGFWYYRKRLLMARKKMSANCQWTDRQKYLKKKIRQEQDIIIYWSFGKKVSKYFRHLSYKLSTVLCQ